MSCYAGKKNSAKVSEVLNSESKYYALKPFHEFAKRVEAARNSLVASLTRLKNEEKTVAGLGASTKGNIILQYCQLDSTLVPVIGEVNEDKFGKCTPGTNIPIRCEDSVLEACPDYLLVLPWHLHAFFDQSDKFKDQNLIYPIDPF